MALVNNASRAHIGNDFNGVPTLPRQKVNLYAGLNSDTGMAILPCEDANVAIEAAAQGYKQTTF